MGAHIVNGEFQSDKYPTCPPGKVPLSVKDPSAQELLWEYAQRRRAVDAEFSADLEAALTTAGYDRERGHDQRDLARNRFRLAMVLVVGNAWSNHEPDVLLDRAFKLADALIAKATAEGIDPQRVMP